MRLAQERAMVRLVRPSVAGLLSASAIALSLSVACTRAEAIEKIPAGTEVTVVTKDGTLVRGTIASVATDTVTLNGERPHATTEISRSSIAEVTRVSAADRASEPVERTLTVPDDTAFDVTLDTALASDSSRVEQPVRATIASPIVIDGITVIPAGSSLTGHVTHVSESGKVKGRAELAFRFTRLTAGSVTYDIDTKPLSYVAASTKKDDAVKIGAGAAAGALIGAIAGGGKGAAIGTAVGAGAGTGVVLATDGKEIQLAEGRKLKVSLTTPLAIRTK